MHRMKQRITKLEKHHYPQQHCPLVLITHASQHGSGGQTIRTETDAQRRARHYAEHPQDKGREVKVVTIVAVSPDHGGAHVVP